MRRLHLRQWLLLLIRMLIVAFLVLAFARPTLRARRGGSGGGGNVEAVVLLDNSMSLNEELVNGTLVSELREKFFQLGGVFHQGDRVSVYQSTYPLVPLAEKKAFSPEMWSRLRQKIQPNYLKSDLPASLARAARLLKNSPFLQKELYILTDGQHWEGLTKEIGEVLKRNKPTDIKYFVLSIPHRSAENISVDDVRIENQLLQINQPLRLKVLLRNHLPDGKMTTLLSVMLNRKKVAQKNIVLEAGESRAVSVRATLTENGFVRGRVELESDILMEDNVRYFNFYLPRKIRVYHLGALGAGRGFLPSILKPALENGIFSYRYFSPADWATADPAKADVLVLEGWTDIPRAFSERCKLFLQQGGGIIVLPPEKLAPENYYKFLKIMNIGTIEKLKGQIGQRAEFLTVAKARFNNPVFDGFFEKSPKQLPDFEVYAHYPVKPAKNARNLLELSDRTPFLLQSEVSRGLVYLFASPLNPEWTELPHNGFVIPLLYRLIYYAGSHKIKDRITVRCGENFHQAFSGLAAPYLFSLRKNNNQEEKLAASFAGGEVSLSYRKTEIPGNYEVLQNGREISQFSVNPWPQESQYNFYKEREWGNLLPGVTVLHWNKDLPAQVLLSRRGKPLWNYILAGALVLLLIEMALARTGMKKGLSRESGAETVMAHKG